MTSRLLALALLAALPLTACKRTAPADAPAAAAPASVSAPAAAAAPATGAHDNLNAVLWMQRSQEYRAAAAQTYHAAAALLDRALKEPNWDALVPEERSNGARGLKPAVIVDVDETVLDNSPYQARLVADGKEYDEVSWDAWVNEKKATAIPGAVDFAKAAQAKGVTVLYLSNRAEHLQAATIANLRAVGMPVADDSVFLGLGTFVKDCEQNGSEKGCRRRLAGQKYRVLMQFGDQLGDFAEILVNTPEGRDAVADAHRDWFGERWWMLPNPSYGGWESAAFGNDYAQPLAARQKAKRDALRLAR